MPAAATAGSDDCPAPEGRSPERDRAAGLRHWGQYLSAERGELMRRTKRAAQVALGFAVLTLASGARAEESLTRFVGHWSCMGRFIANNGPIAGELEMTMDAHTGALIVRHDDAPPGAYHALEVWTPDKTGPGLRAAISDRFSGMRWFASTGWRGDSLTWVRWEDATAAEQFEYVFTGPGELRVDWSTARSGTMKLGDTLACKRTG